MTNNDYRFSSGFDIVIENQMDISILNIHLLKIVKFI